MRFLALDLGSSYTKCFVLEDGRCRESDELPAPPALNNPPTRYELDAEAYFQDVRTLVGRMAAPGTQGVLLSTQMHGYVLTGEDFAPVAPYVSWQDRACRETSPRGKPWIEELGMELDREAFRNSGVPLKDSLGLCNLYARLHAGLVLPAEARLHTLGGYVLARLCGKHVCHLSNAGPLGLADMRWGVWNRRVIASAGMASLRLPELVRDLSPVGETAVNGQRLTMYPDLGDQQVCAFGADLVSEAGLHVNIGTAGLIGSLSRDWREGPFENRAWLMPGTYLRTVSGLPGGRDLNKLHAFFAARDHLAPEECWTRLCAANAAPADVSWDFSDLAASLASLPAGCSLESAACSFYRAMAERYEAAARGMMGDIASVRFSGGTALKNPALRKALLTRFPAARAGEDGLRDVSMGFEALAQFVQMRTEKR